MISFVCFLSWDFQKGGFIIRVTILCAVLSFILFFSFSCDFLLGDDQELNEQKNEALRISFDLPQKEGDVSVEEALYKRVSSRSFTDKPLSVDTVGQLLWAGQGVNIDGVSGATRTSPSAGATYAIDLYVLAGNMNEVAAGLYKYDTTEHDLIQLASGKLDEELASAALGQGFIAEAPVNIVLAAVYDRTVSRYRERGERYVHMEAAHVAQNISLQAEALDIGSVIVGAFDDEEVASLLQLEAEPLLIIPLGY